MILEVNVTQEHIDNGERNNPKKRPLALALKTLFPKAQQVSVDFHTDCQSIGDYCIASIRSGRAGFQFELDAEIARKVFAFDEGQSMEPFTFRVVIE